MSLSAFKVTPRQAKEDVVEILAAGLVPFLRSSPGMGKSSIMRAIAKEYGLILIDIRLSTAAPEDLTGLPQFIEVSIEDPEDPSKTVKHKYATFVPFDIFPLAGTPLPKGKNGWLIFFDEFNSAGKTVQAAAYKVLLDRLINQTPLHEKAAIVAAGNLDTDRAITNNIGTALQSRMIHLEMHLVPDSLGLHSEFMADVAYPNDWDERVIAFLNYKPDRLMDFRPDHNDKTFCCPRTWDFTQKLIKGKTYNFIKDADGNEIYEMDRKSAMYAGAITSGVAIEFINFTKVYTNLPKIEDIVNNPVNTQIPGDPPVKYAVANMLISHSTDKNFEQLTQYMNRMSAELRVVYFRGVMARKPELRALPAFRKAAVELSRYLHD